MKQIPRKKPFTDSEFRSIYSKVPRCTVEVIVIYKNKVLLTKRTEKSWQGQFHIPGGTVLYKEHLTDAVQRIALEEIGIQVSDIEHVGYIEYPSEEKERGFGWSVGNAFVCFPTIDLDENVLKEKSITLYNTIPNNLITEQVPLLEKIFTILNED